MKMSMYRALCGVGAGIILLGGLAGCGKKPEGGAGDVGPTSAVVSVNDSAPVVSGAEDDVEVVAEVKTVDDVAGKQGVFIQSFGVYDTFEGSTIDRSFTDYVVKIAPIFCKGGYVDSDFGRLYNNAWYVNPDNTYSVKPVLDNLLSSSDYASLFSYGDDYVSLEEAVIGYHTGIKTTTGAVTDDVVFAALGDYLCVNGGAQDLSRPCNLGYVLMALGAVDPDFGGFINAQGAVEYGLFDRVMTVGDLAVIIYGGSLDGDISLVEGCESTIDVINSDEYTGLVGEAYSALCSSTDFAYFSDLSVDTVLSCLDVDRILFRVIAGNHVSRVDDASVVESSLAAVFEAASVVDASELNHPELAQMSEDELNKWVVDHYAELDDSYQEDLFILGEAYNAARAEEPDYSSVAEAVVGLK